MNDILFGNNNNGAIRHLSRRYFRKNKIRNFAAVLAIFLTAFLFTSITALAFNLVSSMRLSMQMQKGSKADGTIGYLTEEQFLQLKNSDFVEKAGHRMVLGYAANSPGHTIEINYADGVQQELTFCVPTHGSAPKKANEISTTELALESLGIEPKVGATVPVEFEVRGKTYHYDMVLSGWWEASNDTVSLMIVSDQFVADHPELFRNTFAQDRETCGTTFSEVVLKDKSNIDGQLKEFARSIGGNPDEMDAQNFILCAANQMSKGLIQPQNILFAAAFILMFIVCGYLLIYNIFDISVMQDVRQYGLLRTIGTSTRQIKSLVSRQAALLTLIGLPLGLIAGFVAGWLLLPVVMRFFSFEHQSSQTQLSASPLIVVIASLFTVLTVFISTRKPAKKASHVSPLEAIRYTDQDDCRQKSVRRTNGVKLSYMAFSNLQRNRRRSVFIVISMLLCIVLFNSILIITKSMDEEKFLSRSAKTDFTAYNSTAINVMTGFAHRSDALPDDAVEAIRSQPGVSNERFLYRNTLDDTNVLVDYGFENEFTTGSYVYEDGRISKIFEGYSLHTLPDADSLFCGNVCGVSENFWNDLILFEGETDKAVLKQKMAAGDYVVVGCSLDRLTGDPEETPLTRQLQVGDTVSFYKNGELFKTCTVLARASTIGMEEETANTTTSQMNIGGDAPFLYLSDSVFKELYDEPALLNYGFDVAEGQQEQMDAFLSSYTDSHPAVAYTSTKLLKEQMDSIRNIVLVVGGLIGGIMAFAGLINFTNMIITNIITRRHEFATMQSIGMTDRQLRRLIVYEGVYYAVGADLSGVILAALLALTVIKNVLNSPSMWFFTLHFTLLPALVAGAIYLILAAVIPLIVLRLFHRGTVVERLRTSE